jgi:hypothetical protein
VLILIFTPLTFITNLEIEAWEEIADEINYFKWAASNRQKDRNRDTCTIFPMLGQITNLSSAHNIAADQTSSHTWLPLGTAYKQFNSLTTYRRRNFNV